MLKAKVHAANVFDRDGIKLLLEDAKELFPRMTHLWLDAGYDGKDKGKDRVEKVLGFSAEIVKRPRRWVRVPEGEEPPPYPKGFIVLPRRWVVERSFSWTDKKPQDEQGLREGASERRSVHVCSDEPLDGEKIGAPMRLFRRFLTAVFVKVDPTLECGWRRRLQ